jgi:predicted GNAT family N-acyltransferase
MLAASDVVVGLTDRATDCLVAFARVLTDRVFFAMIFDVIVSADRRGTGLGEELMNVVLARPELARVRSVELVCQPDLVGFYERFGFSTQVGGSLLMRCTTDPLLTRASPTQETD